MATRHIQFLRNEQIYATRQDALDGVEAFKSSALATMKDGEVVIFRYLVNDDPTKVNAIIGYTHDYTVTSGTEEESTTTEYRGLYTIDIADFDVSKIEEIRTRLAEIATASGFKVDPINGQISYSANTTDNYISSATSLTNADDLLDTKLKDVEDRLESAFTSVTLDTTANTLTFGREDSTLTEVVVNIPESYVFDSGSTADENVIFSGVAQDNGDVKIYGDVSVFDCGTY
jgi:hypothetical protein